MPTIPGPADHTAVALSVVASLFHWRWAYPRAARQIEAGVANARLRLYWYILIVTWALGACVLVLWMANDRQWSALRLGDGSPYRAAAGLVLAALYAILAAAQRRAVLSRPDVIERLARTFAALSPLIPHGRAERWGFRAVSVTAGICEELFYRGFVMWYVASFAGPVVALIASSALFGFDHLYLGRTYVLRTAVGGLAFGLVVLIAGALWPAMIIHATADLVSGDLGERVLHRGTR